MKRISITIDVNKVASIIANGIVQYDTDDILDIHLTDGSVSYSFAGYTNCTIEIIRPDGSVFIDSIGDYLKVVDAASGYLTYAPVGEVTRLKGLYFCAVSIYTNGVKTTTSRFSYNVSDGIMDDTSIDKEEFYPVLLNLVNEVSTYKAAEAARELAETARENSTNGIVATATGILNDIEDKLGQIEDLYNAFLSIAHEITGSSFDVTSLVTQQTLEARLENIYPVKISAAADIGTLQDHELAYTTDTGQIYIGASGNKVLNQKEVIISDTAPTLQTVLWIDTINKKVKYFNGTEWTETKSLAVYA